MPNQYMPPIPPIPPIGLAGAYPAGTYSSTIIASVVIINEATEAASYKAVLTTLVGSMIPLSNIVTYNPFYASNPMSY